MLPPEVEALVRLHLPRLRAGAIGGLPHTFRVPLTEDYPACVEVGLIDPVRTLVCAVLAWASDSHDVEAP